MVSLDTSELHFRDLDGALLPGPVEWCPGFVDLGAPSELWQLTSLRCNGRPLRLAVRQIEGEKRLVADWPRTGTGDYQLELRHPGSVPEMVTARIEPRKITPAAFASMVRVLESRLPASIVFSLQKLGALGGLTLHSPAESTVAQELVRLQRAVDGTGSRLGLAAALEQVALDPHRVLTSTNRWVRRERARRVHPAQLPKALAAHNMGADSLPRSLPEVLAEESADVYENRMLAEFHRRVDRRLRRLGSHPAAQTDDGLRAECVRLSESLGGSRLKASFLDRVGTLQIPPDKVTMVIAKRAGYRDAFAGYLEFHRSARAEIEEPALDAPLANLPHLYQAWGLLNVVDATLEAAADCGYTVRSQRIAREDPGGVFVRVLPDGKPAVVLVRKSDGARAQLIPERQYSTSGTPYCSVSYAQRPDVALEIERPDSPPQVILFDPKYKLESDPTGAGDGRPKKADIDTMHAYRDAIRDLEGRRVVTNASILYPGKSRRFAAGLGALQADPVREDQLRSELRKTISAALTGNGPDAVITPGHDPEFYSRIERRYE